MRKDKHPVVTDFIQKTIASITTKNMDTLYRKVQRIIHVHIYDRRRGCFYIFLRPCGHCGPISGKIETFESPVAASIREIKEEIGITVGNVHATDHTFFGISPKGKIIHGITCFAMLPEDISPEVFSFNHEISACVWASKNDALTILAQQKEHQEGYHGILYLLKHGVTDQLFSKGFVQPDTKMDGKNLIRGIFGV